MHKVTNRPERVAELIRRELAQIMSRELDEPLARRATLTDVVVSRDLKNARVYFSTLAGASEAPAVAKVLNHAAGFLRHELRNRLAMKNTPELRFYFDDSLERGARIDRLIDEALGRGKGGKDGEQ